MPERLLPLVEPHCRVQLMTLEAAMKGDKELALQSLLLDPLCANLAPSDVRKMGLELMDATAAWLPQFKKSGKSKARA
jgi:alpha-galactosidase/6-phospho-beta-glucosidase family protein